MSSLSATEQERYSRHLRIPAVGLEGQLRLKAAKILLVGTGGLGSPVALYLAAAGIGTLGLVEFDAVSLSNLQRQVLYDAADLGKPKLWRAKARLEAQNPQIRIVAHEGPLTATNVLTLFTDYDLVIDGSDNFATRYLVNDACWLLGKPFVHAAIYRFEGQVATFVPGQGPCYRCLFPEPPAQAPNCSEGGVLGVLAGTVGTMQATEALKLVLGIGTPLIGSLLTYDALTLETMKLGIPPDPACVLCGPQATLTALVDYVAFCPTSQPDDRDADDDWALSAVEVAARRHHVRVLDLRETASAPLTGFAQAEAVTLAALPGRLADLDPGQPWVVLCQYGTASEQAVRLLRAAGFAQAWHLQGGLLAWQRWLDEQGLASPER